MENILDEWEKNKELFLNSIFLMSDYDGTLTPIVDRPEDAKILENVKDYLSKLVRYCPIGIISGRSLEDLKNRVGIKQIYYSGNHGYEISGPDINFVKEEAMKAKEVIEKICEDMEAEMSSFSGIIIENKEYTASVHYRLADEIKVSKIGEILREIAQPYLSEGIIEISRGKKVFEISPALDWDKGKAVSLLWEMVGLEEKAVPIYLGDDVTDEYAFSAIEESGIGILVSEEDRESIAGYRLNNPGQVEDFLERLLRLFKKS